MTPIRVHRDSSASVKVRELDVGDRILLCQPQVGAEPGAAWAGQVQGRTHEGLIAVLTGDGATGCDLRVGQPLSVEYWKDFGRQVFDSRVLSWMEGQRPRLVLAEPPADRIRRLPRRGDYRIATSLPAVLHCRDEEHPCLITDLSAGGCRVVLGVAVAVGDRVALTFTLPGAKDEEGVFLGRLAAEVRRVRPVNGSRGPGRRDRPNQPTCSVGLRFDALAGRTESTLMRYVALRQRELIQQGALH